MNVTDIWALVPLKQMDRGKERLAGRLDARQRRALIGAMAEDVLQALRAAGLQPRRIVLVSEDPQVAGLAQRLGIGLHRPPSAAQDPLNSALAAAAEQVRGQGAQHLLVLHADLPLASAPALHWLFVTHAERVRTGEGRIASLVSDTAGEGSNCLLLSPPSSTLFRFGFDSRARHHQSCASEGVHCIDFACPALSFDIDHPSDLDALVHLCESPDNGCGTRTQQLLAAELLMGRPRENSCAGVEQKSD